MLSERRLHTGTVELNYGEGPPNGPPFVILHGGAASWRYADDLIALLVSRWHVFAPDFRGHGLSGRVPGRYTLRDYAADTAAFLDQAVREPAVVYGHSLGAEVAIVVAATYPDLVRAVIHGDVTFRRDDHPAKADEDNLQYKLHMAQNELWHRLAGRPSTEIAAALRAMPVYVPGTEEPVRAGDAFGEANPWFEFQATNLHRLDLGMLAAVREGRDAMRDGYEPETLLPAISCPVLILQADPAAGGALSDADVELGLRLLPQATHLRLDGIGHELHGRHAQRVLDAIGPFLKTVS